MFSENPRAVKRRDTEMRKLGWDGSEVTKEDYEKLYREEMAGRASIGGSRHVPKGRYIKPRKGVNRG